MDQDRMAATLAAGCPAATRRAAQSGAPSGRTGEVFGSSRYLVSVTRLIPAERQWLFDVVADPAQHPVIDGSGSVKAARPGNPDRLSLGATFSMDMELGTDY